ncbi:MAG: response regulator [Candidatus Promineifilaceae bacterium]|jgi:DNA-binding response OmpR family regulator
MTKARILVVEDDVDIAEMLRITFQDDGYSVSVVGRGSDVFDETRRGLPDLIILDILLPGMDGYEVCRQLRTTTRTSHIPIIFLTQKDARGDRLAGLELGADDYITKPFDLDELKLRSKNAISGHQRMNMTDPRTGLPAARLIEEQLRSLMSKQAWSYTELTVANLQPFVEAYGFVAGDEVLRFVALTIGKVVDQFGSDDDFVGQAASDSFVIITHSEEAPQIIDEIQNEFTNAVRSHYNFLDSERGGIEMADGSVAPLMFMTAGSVTHLDGPFSDIREITEAAAVARRAGSSQ